MEREDREKLVLVVEDDPATCSLLVDLFADSGFRSLQTGSASVALRLARQHVPDALVLDLLLSEGSGLELLERVKEQSATRDIPAIVISGADDLLRHPIALQADAALPKPFSGSSLLKLVDQVTADHFVPMGRGLTPP